MASVRELETSLQQFGEFLLRRQLVRPTAARFMVRWVREVLRRPAVDAPLADQVRSFCDDLERTGRCQDWQVRQAEEALQIYFVRFLGRTDWRHVASSVAVDADGRMTPLDALHILRTRIRARHYSFRTESSYSDWGVPFSGVPSYPGRSEASSHSQPRPRLPNAYRRQSWCLGQHAESGPERGVVSL